MRNTTVDDSDSRSTSAETVACPKHGLPSFAYTSEMFWEQEKTYLFPNAWVFSGFSHEIPNAGDVAPVTVGGTPILLVRDRDGAVRAFHNICRHRCIKLVDSSKNVGRLIRCPYHSWTYGLDGRLRATPYFGGPDPQSVPDGFDRSDYGLREINCGIWCDWVFVNVNANAQPFCDFIAPLRNRIDEVDLERIALVGMIDFGEIDTNWKFLIENFVEPYHVQFVHSETTAQPLVNHHTVRDGHCVGCAFVPENTNTNVNADSNLLSVTSSFLTLFPNFAFGTYAPNQIGVHLNVPLGPGKTHQRRAIYVIDGTELNELETKQLKKLWTKVHQEDHEMCVRLQEGRASDVAREGGLLSPHWEDSVYAFQTMVSNAVSSES